MIITKSKLAWLKAFSETSAAQYIHDKALLFIAIGNKTGLDQMRKAYRLELFKFMRGM
jgi:hypothetical protein